MLGPWIETRSGKKFTFLEPQPDQIDIADIAYALANQCRYNGHCNRFYSVAEHSVLVAALVPEGFRLDALLHDAAEAYLSDIPSPVKQFMPEYKKLEAVVMTAIAAKFGINKYESEEVHKADKQQLSTEAYNLLPSKGDDWCIETWKPFTERPDFKDGKRPLCLPPQYAFGLFMTTFENLTQPMVLVPESKIILA